MKKICFQIFIVFVLIIYPFSIFKYGLAMAAENIETGTQEEKTPPIQWESDAQKARCEQYLEHLNEEFVKARDFSILGDPCATSDHAKEFLSLVETSRKGCPERFLESRGFTSRIIKNISTIRILGEERCKYR